jgi:hypothetical protein
MSLRKHKTHHVAFKLTELEHTQLLILAEEQGLSPGECCRARLQGSLRGETIPIFERGVLEELSALRSIVSSVIYDLVTESGLRVERMYQIIAYADEMKFQRATHNIRELLNRPVGYSRPIGKPANMKS